MKAIVEWPKLKTVKEVKSFLGLAGYYRKFVKDFAKIAAPLTELTKEKVKWRWEAEEQKAFQDLKQAMSHTPVLIHANPDLLYTVTSDASGFAVGAVLSQDQGQGPQPIAFLSHKMTEAERGYPVHEQELLAVFVAMKEWRCYLHGSPHPVHVVTDHMSLQYLNTQPHLSKRQIGWVEYLGQFKYIVHYRPGTENRVADALSRRGDYQREAELEDEKSKTASPPVTQRIKFQLAALTRMEDEE